MREKNKATQNKTKSSLLEIYSKKRMQQMTVEKLSIRSLGR